MRGHFQRRGGLTAKWVFLLLSAGTLSSGGAEFAELTRELKQLSLEELMELEVTMVSRRPVQLAEAPAAIHVITPEELRRSGLNILPEAFRLVPGMQVARVNSHTWAISSRGFNGTAANKLQVMIDGRSVYTPLFSGVFWDVQDILLEDLERIEVIRGPGASLWGANAVNGIINVQTKSARETQGWLVTGGGGTEERAFGALRYGGQMGPNAYFRLYAKYFFRDDLALPNGDPAGDDWRMGRGGFRVDWEPSDQNRFTLQGDLFSGEKGETSTILSPTEPFIRQQTEDTELFGGNVLGRWTHSISLDSEIQLQMYYDRTHRDIPRFFMENRDTFHLDFQHRFAWGQRQELIWGLGYHVTSDDVANTFSVAWDPDHRTTQVYSVFLQDEIAIFPERLRLVLGSKFEHNDFTGFQIQPNARLALTPAEGHLIWAAVSRAVRSPTRLDTDLRLKSPLAAPGSPRGSFDLFAGDEDFRSEELIAYELGYRLQPLEWLTFDIAGFYNDYDHLRSLEFGAIAALDGINTRTNILANNLEGETYGVEVAAKYQMTPWWRWQAGYTYLQMQLHTKPGSRDFGVTEATEGNDPHHQFFLRASLDLPGNVGFDAFLRYVDALPNLRVRDYLLLDLRLSWRPKDNLELALVGQNLFDDQHREFSSARRTQVEHGVYGIVTWHF